MSEREDDITAAIIVIGNEILSGRTQDANTVYIASKLSTKGIHLKEVRTIVDNPQTIIDTILWAKKNHNYVFTTGGIGPTHDDVTADSVARTFNTELERNAEAEAAMLEYYGKEELTEARLKMADIPKGAKLIPNPISAAPGFILDNVYVMAGVPKIMQTMFNNVLHSLEGGVPILSSSITCSVPESKLAKSLGDLQADYDNAEIGSYPHYRGGNLGLNIVVRSTNEQILDELTNKVIEAVQDNGEEPIVTYHIQ